MEYKDWQIIYSSNMGVEARALEFLYGELGSRLLRQPGVYSIPTLKCCEATEMLPAGNAVIIGTLKDNPILKRFLALDDVPKDGYCVRTLEHPEDNEKKLVLIAGDVPPGVLYGCVDFIDDVLPTTLQAKGNGLFMDSEAMKTPLPNLFIKRAPETTTRSVFTWGHTFNDYRGYIKNMARLKLNELILWNEYLPLNGAEVVEYAHSWGIKVLWGFSWGWNTGCGSVAEKMLHASPDEMKALEDSIVSQWQQVWNTLPGDGIYFQTFTECGDNSQEGHSIADVAVTLVNRVASRIWEIKPDLRIIFGLHATSVKTHLPTIAKADERLLILWEDCGTFPFNADLDIDEAGTEAFVETLFRQKHPMGLVYKCQMMLDWMQFMHQSGPYVMGCMSQETINNDVQLIMPIWKHLKTLWLRHGELAYKLARKIHAHRDVCDMLNVAANLTCPIQWPTALMAELFWNTQEPYQKILARVMRRTYLIN